MRPPVMPVRPDNAAAEKDGDRDAVFLDHRSKRVIASMSVVERYDQTLRGKPFPRLDGPRRQRWRSDEAGCRADEERPRSKISAKFLRPSNELLLDLFVDTRDFRSSNFSSLIRYVTKDLSKRTAIGPNVPFFWFAFPF